MNRIENKTLLLAKMLRPKITSHNLGFISPLSAYFSAVTLRPYQKECIDASIKAFEQGQKRIAVSMPVGCGKTVILANLLNALQPPNSTSKAKTLVLAHREELINQAYSQITKWCPHHKVSVDRANHFADFDADVVVASVPTIGRKPKDGEFSSRLLKYNQKQFGLIIIDEAHHSAAATYRRILSHFNAFNQGPVRVWGCSATLYRHDGISLKPVFEDIVFHKKVIDMISEGWLADVQVVQVKTDTDLSQVSSSGSDFNLKQLSDSVNTALRNETIAKVYLDEVVAKGFKSTLVFAVDIKHIEALLPVFRSKGVSASAVHSKTPSHERQHIIKEFTEGRLSVLVNCGIVTEGVDIPRIDAIILARPTCSSVLLQQMLGRGMRVFPEKSKCLVLDCVDVMQKGASLATVPTLLGLDPRFDMQSKTLSEVAAEVKAELVQESVKEEEKYKLSPFVNPFDLERIELDAVYIRNFTKLAWARCGPYRFVLSVPKGEAFIVEMSSDGSFIASRSKVQRTAANRYYTKKATIDTEHIEDGKKIFGTLKDAFEAAETFIADKYGESVFNHCKWDALWRDECATKKQREMIKKKKVITGGEFWREGLVVSRGLASTLITCAKFGGHGAALKIKRDFIMKEKAKRSRNSPFL